MYKRLIFFIFLLSVVINIYTKDKNTQTIKEKKSFIGDPNGGFWGNIHFKKQKFHKALEKYIQALNHLSGNELAKLNYNIGNVYYKLNNNKKASEFYENSMLLAKEDKLKAMILYNQGLVEFKNQNYSIARELFKKSLKYNSDDENARYNFEVCDLLKKEGEKKQDPENKNNEDQKKNSNEQNEQNKNNQNKNKQNSQMSKDDIEKILRALDEKEKEENTQRSMEDQKSNNKGIRYW